MSSSSPPPAGDPPSDAPPPAELTPGYIADLLPLIIWFADQDGRTLYYSAEWYRYTGLSQEESLAFGWQQVVHPDDRASSQAAREAGLASQRPFQVESRLRGRDGQYRWFEAKVLPLRDESGAFRAWLGTSINIDDRKRAQEELEASQRRQALIAGASRAFVVQSTSLPTVLDTVARYTAEALGDGCVVRLSAEEGEETVAVGVHFTDPAAQTRARAAADLPTPIEDSVEAQVLRSGASYVARSAEAAAITDEVRAQYAGILGDEALGGLIVAPLRAGNRMLGTITIVRGAAAQPFSDADVALLEEIADRAALSIRNAQLLAAERSARQAAQQALSAREQFLGSVTHDLRSPLTTIRGVVQLAQRRLGRMEGEQAERLAGDLARIDRATAKMTAMIGELLDLTVQASGRRLDLNRAPVDLVALVRRCAADAMEEHPARVIRVDSTVAELTGTWDAVRIERVVANLLSNAIKYSPEGSEVRVAIGREETDGRHWAVLSVADRGVGIPAADLPHVFEQFYRGGNVAHTVTGTGIGLAGVRQIVEQHGGTVAVASTEGQGTTFTVRLPLDPPVPQPPTP